MPFIKIFQVCGEMVKNKTKQNFFTKLIKDDTAYSVKNFYLLAITAIAVILLIPLPYILFVEVHFNHTIATDFGGMAAYITAIVGLIASAGITNAWAEHSENKYRAERNKNSTVQEEIDIIEECKE